MHSLIDSKHFVLFLGSLLINIGAIGIFITLLFFLHFVMTPLPSLLPLLRMMHQMHFLFLTRTLLIRRPRVQCHI